MGGGKEAVPLSLVSIPALLLHCVLSADEDLSKSFIAYDKSNAVVSVSSSKDVMAHVPILLLLKRVVYEVAVVMFWLQIRVKFILKYVWES